MPSYHLTATQITEIYIHVQEYYQEKKDPKYEEQALKKMMQFLKFATLINQDKEKPKSSAFNLNTAQSAKTSEKDFLNKLLLKPEAIDTGIKVTEALKKQEWFYFNDLTITQSSQLRFWPLATESSFQHHLLEQDSNLTILFKIVSLENIDPFISQYILPIYMEELIHHRCLPSSVKENKKLMKSINHASNGIKNPVLAQEYLSFLALTIMNQVQTHEVIQEVLNIMNDFLNNRAAYHEHNYINLVQDYEHTYQRSATKFYNRFLDNCITLDLKQYDISNIIKNELLTKNQQEWSIENQVGATYQINLRMLALNYKVAVNDIKQCFEQLTKFYEYQDTPKPFVLLNVDENSSEHFFKMNIMFNTEEQKLAFEKDFKLFYTYLNEQSFTFEKEFIPLNVVNTLRLKAKMEENLPQVTQKKKMKI